MRMPKLLYALVASCVLAALAPLGTAQAAAGPTIDNASLTNGGRPCSATTPPVALGYFAKYLQAAGADDTYSYSGYDYTFTIWPIADPAAATSITTAAGPEEVGSGVLATAQLPADVLTEGGSYAWQVQLTTSNGTSPWSRICTFRYDNTTPAAPSISSANYPPYGQGEAPLGQLGQFTFDAGGDLDTAGFQYGWGNLGALGCSFGAQLVCPDFLAEPGTVRVTSPGGTASVTLNPVGSQDQTLVVAALDAAGNRSAPVEYQVFVPDSGPIVTQADSHPICGSVAKLVFSPRPGLGPVSSYTYSVDQGAAVTVPASADGTARVSIKENRQPASIAVTSTGADGFRSSEANSYLNVNPQVFVFADMYTDYGQPVGGVGVLGHFTFWPPFVDGPAPTAFSYRFPGGPRRTVAAGEDGSATVQWAPTRAGQQTLTVQAVNADGSPASCEASYTFTVAR